MKISRRLFLGACGAARLAGQQTQRYSIGITTNTRGGWENDVFLSFREAREAGYYNVESFCHYFTAFRDKPEDLKKKLQECGVHFVTISNGAPMEMHFEDPAKHEKIIAEHIDLVRFIKKFGCGHLKINTGPRRPDGTTPEDLKQMAVVFNEIGRRTTAEGLRFALHAHMWSQMENRREIDAIMSSADPRHVWFVLDTGHITMAGMDPVQLARDLGTRVIEFHMKDVDPANKGGAKTRVAVHEPMTHPIFFPLGKGGVDFDALMSYLDGIKWTGWLTVELDSSPFQPPKQSAIVSREFLQKKLNLVIL